VPSSRYEQISKIMEIIVNLKPTSVLDIGAGFGKYGVLTREYLELWDERYEYDRATWRHRIDAVEGYGRYITPLHEYVYDNIYVGDATQIIPTLQTQYDLALLIDIFEHVEREAGRKLIKDLLKLSKGILICVPSRYGQQGAVFDNPYEIHRANWSTDDLKTLGAIAFVPDENKRICIVGEQAVRRWEQYQRAKVRQRIKRYFPGLTSIYRKTLKGKR